VATILSKQVEPAVIDLDGPCAGDYGSSAYSPVSELLGFKPIALSSLVLLGFITLLYFAVSEVAKRIFYLKMIRQDPATVNQPQVTASGIQSANPF
jgi:hypothetical protein